MSQSKEALVIVAVIEREGSACENGACDSERTLGIRTRASTRQYTEGWERVFGRPKTDDEDLPN